MVEDQFVALIDTVMPAISAYLLRTQAAHRRIKAACM